MSITKSTRLEIHACDHCNLACVGCNHLSPFLKKKEYLAEDYIPWIMKILESGAKIDTLAISGGEPFLNKTINDFCKKIKEAFPKIQLEIFSNLFWLKNDDSLDKFAISLSSVNHLVYSLYKPIVERMGGEQKLHDLVKLAEKKFAISSACTVGTVNEYFALAVHSEIPKPRKTEEICYLKDCTQLRSDGVLFRCPMGLGIGNQKNLPQGFVDSKEMTFDLKTDSLKNFDDWRFKWAFDACDFCGCGKGRELWIPWESNREQVGR